MVDHGNVADNHVAVVAPLDAGGHALLERAFGNLVDAAGAVGAFARHNAQGSVFSFLGGEHDGLAVPIPAPNLFAQVALAERIALGGSKDWNQDIVHMFAALLDQQGHALDGAGADPAARRWHVALVEEDERDACDVLGVPIEGGSVDRFAKHLFLAKGIGAVVFHEVGL